ncbi:YL1-domain-containing protein [Canariomyces notabilis]|uniref:YL1-domain-containing protein n=1 Tax=Canariomyces notabilis TaxID=2074819 RepID=A0AAN6TIQ6_9PEZI|nr:YL1-domain-containing protein [Canariomyces arenarius]
MAADEDGRKSPSLDDLSDIESTSESDGESDAGQPEKIEWLVTSRSRRSTAGNRMKSLLANEEPAAEDSDLELLFAEDENDAGFTDDNNDDASDVLMDSSSDEEEKEVNTDELEGEKELERQAREKRMAQRKRKAQEAIPAKFRKKVRIEQPVRQPRPKKKSERTSWLPSPADMPTRASERQTTRLSKQQLHQKMVTDELRRRKQLEKMEKKAKMLEALKKPPMTQAERLAEAAIVEKRNSKSLNRWEEAEKQREEERLRKIAALHSRKLDGPVVTFWSGIQELQEGQSKHVGNLVSMEEKAPRKKRQSAAAALAIKGAETAGEPSTPATPIEQASAKPLDEPPGLKTENNHAIALLDQNAAPSGDNAADHGTPTVAPRSPAPLEAPIPAAPALTSMTMAPPPIPPPPENKPAGSGVLAAPILAPPAGVSSPMLGGQMPMLGYPASGEKSNILAPASTSHTPSPLSMPPSAPVTASNIPPQHPVQTSSLSKPSPKITIPPPPLPPSTTTPLQMAQGNAELPSANPHDTAQEPPTASEPPREGKVTRSCIILQNFDETAIKDRQVQTQILFGRKMNKLAKPAHRPLCVITNHPAKYRDPKTGLPYYNSYAYREIRRVYRGDYKWSRLLGAWVGRGDYAASGVPDWFLDPSKAKKTAEPVLALKDGVEELKQEEEEEQRPDEEPRLEPIEGGEEVGAAEPVIPQAASTS